MAIVKGFIQATGSIKGVSFYTMAGSDKVIMRAKGGPSKKRMATGKEFENVRKQQAEWAACVQFARAVRDAVGNLYPLSDHNLMPGWTGMGKKLLNLDTTGETGKRSLRLTTYKQVLEGFQLNRRSPLASVLRVTPAFDTDREKLTARVTFPPIVTATDLSNPDNLPYFRLVISLGTVSDIVYTTGRAKNYYPANEKLQGLSICATTNWLSANDRLPEQTLSVEFEERFVAWMTDDITLLLGVGVEFGKVGFGGEIVPVKRSGAAKVVAVR